MRITMVLLGQMLWVSVVPGVAVLAEETSRAAPVRPTLRPGDRFTVDLKYSNAWEVASVHVDGRSWPGAPLTPAELAAFRKSPSGTKLRKGPSETTATEPAMQPVPRAEDPLFVDMNLRCEANTDRTLTIVPAVSRVRYFDDRGRDWTISGAKRGSRVRAEAIIESTSSAWSPSLRDELEREMLEEQLLGAAVVLLNDVEIRISLDSSTGQPAFVDLATLLDRALPARYPKDLRPRIERFFQDALARVVSVPASRDLSRVRRGANFAVDGVTYDILEVKATRGRVRVRAAGSTKPDASGRRLREVIVFDARTGVVLEATSAVVQNDYKAGAARFGFMRWQTRLKSFRRGPKRSITPPAVE